MAAHSNLALLYESKGKIQEAANHWAARIQLATSSADPWVVRARKKLSQYNLPVPEVPELRIRKRMKAAELGYEAGARYMRARKWSQAAKEFERVLMLDPSHRKASAKLEEVYRKLQKRQRFRTKAISSAVDTASRRPVLVPRRVPPGKGPLIRLGEAPVPREQIVMRPPPVAAVPRGRVGVSRAESISAQQLAQQMVQEKAKTRGLTVQELYERGVTSVRQGRYQDAVTSFQQVLALDPNHRDAREGLKRAQAAFSKSTLAEVEKP